MEGHASGSNYQEQGGKKWVIGGELAIIAGGTVSGLTIGPSTTFVTPVIDDGDAGVTITSADQTNAAATVTIPNIADAADEFVMKDTAQTLTLKSLTTPIITDGDTGIKITSADQTHAAPTVTIPDIVDAADTFLMADTEQTMTLKTLTTPIIASIYQDAGKTKAMALPNTASDTLAAIAATQTFTNKTVDSATNSLKNTVMAYAGNITRAEMVAGKTLVAARAGLNIKVLSVKMLVTGAFNGGNGTSFVLKDTSSTVTILTALKAALTNGARISTEGLAIADVSEGAGMTGALTAANGILVAADAAWDAGTGIDIVIQYMYV